MKLSELKQIIRECIEEEYINEKARHRQAYKANKFGNTYKSQLGQKRNSRDPYHMRYHGETKPRENTLRNRDDILNRGAPEKNPAAMWGGKMPGIGSRVKAAFGNKEEKQRLKGVMPQWRQDLKKEKSRSNIKKLQQGKQNTQRVERDGIGDTVIRNGVKVKYSPKSSYKKSGIGRKGK